MVQNQKAEPSPDMFVATKRVILGQTWCFHNHNQVFLVPKPNLSIKTSIMMEEK